MSYSDFEEEVNVLVNLENMASFLYWDQEVMMPENGFEARSKQQSTLSKVRHERIVSDRFGELIDGVDEKDLDEDQKCNLREVRRERNRVSKVPGCLVEKISEKSSECLNTWEKAREEDDFESYAEELKDLVELKRRYAAEIDEDKEAYKVLFEDFEPYLGFERMEEILTELKENLKPLIQQIQDGNTEISTGALKGSFDEEKALELDKELVRDLGLTRDLGRLDTSAAPFTIGNSFEARITTRTNNEDLKETILASVHETGHALYNLGVPQEHYGTPRGQTRELSIDESQSRLFENHVGRSQAFWEHLLPKLKEKFPNQFEDRTVEDCFESANQVYEDNLIRVDADELTYHMHIIVRFEIGKALINGEMEVEELPKIWNEKMEEYLGVVPETDAEGVMQDAHWAGGSFGYFPTYTLGSVIAAQLYKKLEKDVENTEEKIESGEFEPILEWLRENIHRKGRLLKTEELVKEATGQKPTAEPFLDYIEEKYSKLYDF